MKIVWRREGEVKTGVHNREEEESMSTYGA